MPTKADSDAEGCVFWKWSAPNAHASAQWDVEYPNRPDYWMPVPPLPSPEPKGENAFEKWWREADVEHDRHESAKAAWNAAQNQKGL